MSNRELGNELRVLKAQIGNYEKNRNEATADMTEARMSSRLLEEDMKKTKRQYEDAKALMKLFENEADMARSDAREQILKYRY